MRKQLSVQQSDSSWVFVSWDMEQGASLQVTLCLDKQDVSGNWAECYHISVASASQSWHMMLPDPGNVYRVLMVDDATNVEEVLAESEPFKTFPAPRVPFCPDMQAIYELSQYEEGCSSWS